MEITSFPHRESFLCLFSLRMFLKKLNVMNMHKETCFFWVGWKNLRDGLRAVKVLFVKLLSSHNCHRNLKTGVDYIHSSKHPGETKITHNSEGMANLTLLYRPCKSCRRRYTWRSPRRRERPVIQSHAQMYTYACSSVSTCKSTRCHNC